MYEDIIVKTYGLHKHCIHPKEKEEYNISMEHLVSEHWPRQVQVQVQPTQLGYIELALGLQEPALVFLVAQHYSPLEYL